jgi:calmodulin
LPTMGREKQYEAAKKKARDAFILFEHKEGSKLVDIKEIPTVIRSLGINPTNSQLSIVVEQITAALGEEASYVTIEQFENAAAKFLVDQEPSLFRDDYFTLIRAFRAFDAEGKGYIEVEQFKTIMSHKGDSLSADEVNNMISFAADDAGKVWYEDYAWKLSNDGRKI